MGSLKVNFLLAVSVLVTVLAFILVHHFVLFNLIFPDICIFHTRETTLLFRLFYDLPASEGFHPVPSVLNYALTAGAGALTGFFMGKKFLIKWR